MVRRELSADLIHYEIDNYWREDWVEDRIKRPGKWSFARLDGSEVHQSLLRACEHGVQYLEQLRIVADRLHEDLGLEDVISEMRAAIKQAGGYLGD